MTGTTVEQVTPADARTPLDGYSLSLIADGDNFQHTKAAMVVAGLTYLLDHDGTAADVVVFVATDNGQVTRIHGDVEVATDQHITFDGGHVVDVDYILSIHI